MTLATEENRTGHRPLTVVELHLDFCSLVYGVAPCTAALGVTDDGVGKCHNVRIDCQDPDNYDGDTATAKVYRFCSGVEPPIGLGALPVVVGDPTFTPRQADPGRGLGKKAAVTVQLRDMPHSDIGFDPYVDDGAVAGRGFDPLTQGSFMGRLIARNPYYHGRLFKVWTGFVADAGFDFADGTWRTYVIERIEGAAGGVITVVGQDPSILLSDDRALCPVVTTGALTAALTAGETGSLTLTGEVDWTKYPATNGGIWFEDELIIYATRAASGDDMVFSTLTRGEGGSTAAAHDVDDVGQVGKYFSGPPCTTAGELMTFDEVTGHDYGGLPSTWVPKADYAAEDAEWFNGTVFQTWIKEPTGVETLLEELAEQAPFIMDWDETLPEMTLTALKPSLEPVTTFTDDGASSIVKDSLSVKRRGEKRKTRVIVRFGVRDYGKDIEERNLANNESYISASAEDPALFGDVRILEINSRWIIGQGQARRLAARTLYRLDEEPREVTLKAHARDSGIRPGEYFNIRSFLIQNVFGGSEVALMQAISTKPIKDGGSIIVGQDGQFKGQYRQIAPTGLSAWADETQANRDQFGAICQTDGTFPDGTPGNNIL